MNDYAEGNNVGVNSAEDYQTLRDAEKRAVQLWIVLTIVPARREYPYSSYGLKHDFEKVGFYLTNGQMKGAMKQAGYSPVDASALNWTFRISRVCNQKIDALAGLRFDMRHLSNEERLEFFKVVQAARNEVT